MIIITITKLEVQQEYKQHSFAKKIFTLYAIYLILIND